MLKEDEVVIANAAAGVAGEETLEARVGRLERELAAAKTLIMEAHAALQQQQRQQQQIQVPTRKRTRSWASSGDGDEEEEEEEEDGDESDEEEEDRVLARTIRETLGMDRALDEAMTRALLAEC
jgi:TATA-binding protein-associated factor Taf7